jgi:hypothetical protein
MLINSFVDENVVLREKIKRLQMSLEIVESLYRLKDIESRYNIDSSRLVEYIDVQICSGRLPLEYSDDFDIWEIMAQELKDM